MDVNGNRLKIRDFMEAEITNIVGKVNAGTKLDLLTMYEQLSKKNSIRASVDYNPESFVGLIYKQYEGKKTVSYTFFNTGKIIIAGCASVEAFKIHSIRAYEMAMLFVFSEVESVENEGAHDEVVTARLPLYAPSSTKRDMGDYHE